MGHGCIVVPILVAGFTILPCLKLPQEISFRQTQPPFSYFNDRQSSRSRVPGKGKDIQKGKAPWLKFYRPTAVLLVQLLFFIRKVTYSYLIDLDCIVLYSFSFCFRVVCTFLIWKTFDLLWLKDLQSHQVFESFKFLTARDDEVPSGCDQQSQKLAERGTKEVSQIFSTYRCNIPLINLYIYIVTLHLCTDPLLHPSIMAHKYHNTAIDLKL